MDESSKRTCSKCGETRRHRRGSWYCYVCEDAYKKARYERKHEEIRTYQNEYHRTIGKKVSQEIHHRRRARQRGNFVEAVDYKVVYERDGGICYLCLEPVPFDDGSMDHVIPIAKGGPHSYANVKLSCLPCNLEKGSKLVD